jgi:hypothetical protein
MSISVERSRAALSTNSGFRKSREFGLPPRKVTPHSVLCCRSNRQSEHWHLDIAPETAVRRINGAAHLVCGCADIDNVNRGHLRTEVKQLGWGDGLSVTSGTRSI